MANQENLTVKISVEGKQAAQAVGKFAKSLDLAGKEAKETSKEVEKAEGAFTRFGKAAIAINQSLEIVSKAFRTVQSITSKPLINALALERSTAEVRTLLDATQKDVVNFNREILSLQRQFGTAPQVAAKAFYDAISSGAVDAEGAIKLLNVAQKTAIGGVTDLQTAVNGITNILNAYGLSAGDSARVSDVLFLSMRAGKTTVTELSAELGKVLTFAENAGVSFEELSAAVATVTTAGVQTNVATTALRAAIVALLRPTEDMKAAYAQLGISSIDATLKQQGLVKTIRQIAGSVGGSTAALTKLFGSVESLPAVTALASDTIGAKFDELAGDIEAAGGRIGEATDDAFGELADTADFKIALVQARFDATLTEIGLAFKETFVSISETVGSAFDQVVIAFHSVAKASKPVVEAFKAIDFTALFETLTPLVLGLATAYTATLVPSIATATAGFVAQKVAILATAVATGTLTSTMAALVAPMALAAAKGLLIVGAIAGIEIAIRNVDKIMNGFVTLWTEFILLLDKADEKFIRLRISLKEAIGSDTANDQRKLLDNLRSQVELQTRLSDIAEENEATDFDFGFLGQVFEQGRKAVDAFNGSLVESKELAKDLSKAVGGETGGPQVLPPTIDPASIQAAKAAYDELVDSQKLIGATAQKTAKLQLDARLEEIQAIQDQLAETEQLAGKESELFKARKLAQEEYRATIEAIQEEQTKQLEEARKGFDSLVQAQSLYGLNARQTADALFEKRMMEIDAIEEQLRLTGQLAGRESELARARAIAGEQQASGRRLAGPAPEFVSQVQDVMTPITETIQGFGSVITGPVAAAQAAISAGQAIVDAVPNLLNSAANLVNSLTDLPNAILEGVQNLLRSIPRFIAEFIPNIINAIPELAMEFVNSLIIGIPDAVVALVDGILNAIDMIIDRIPEFATKLISGLISGIPKMQSAFIRLMVQAGPRLAIGLIKAAPDIAVAIVQGIIDGIRSIGDSFASIFDFGSLGGEIGDVVTSAGDSLLSSVESIGEETFRVLDLGAQAKGLSLADDISSAIEGATTRSTSFLKNAWNFVWDFTSGLFNKIISDFKAMFEFVIDMWKSAFEFAEGIFDAVVNLFKTLWDSVKQIFDGVVTAFSGVFDIFKAAGQFVVELFQDPIGAFKNLFENVGAAFGKIIDGFKGVFDGFLDGVEGAFDFLGDIGTTVFDAFKDAISKVGNLLKELFTFEGGGRGTVEKFLGFDFPFVAFAEGGRVPGMPKVAGDSLKNDVIPAMLSPGEVVIPRSAVAKGFEGVSAFLADMGMMRRDERGRGGQPFGLGGLVDAIIEEGSNVVGGVSSVVSGLSSTVIGAYDAITSIGGNVDFKRLFTDPVGAIKDALRSMTGFLKGIFEDWIKSNLPGFQTGGFVSGYGGTDSVGAMLSPGEFVLNRQATARLGTDFLDRVNRGQTPMAQGDQTINVTINTTQQIDEAFIRGKLIPEVRRQLKRDSLDGRRVLSPTGVR